MNDQLEAAEAQVPIRVLVCGGRHYKDFKHVWRTLTKLNSETPISCVISGGCSGADTHAETWAAQGNVPTRIYRADWALGPAAGPIRNQEMLDKGKPDLVLAFPGGRGTADMVSRAKNAGVQIMEIED